jgi:hypothetical protein
MLIRVCENGSNWNNVSRVVYQFHFLFDSIQEVALSHRIIRQVYAHFLFQFLFLERCLQIVAFNKILPKVLHALSKAVML